MTGIFISYRQADAKAWAISLRDDLAKVFGEDQVFLDKDTLQAGNWRDQITHALDQCKVVLVVIGARWLTITDEQNRPRIHLPDDVHHQEVALALTQTDVTVIPVLVDEASMPRLEQLPEDLRKLCDQHARKIGDTQGRRKADLEVLIQDIQKTGGIQRRVASKIDDESAATGRFSWLKLDMHALIIAFVLTFVVAIYAYSGGKLKLDELFVLLLFLYALTKGVKWLWQKRRNNRQE